MRGPSPRTWMWHQDGGIQNHDLETHPRPRMSVKMAYFLTDVGEPGRGNFSVIPGSHLRDTIDRPSNEDNDLAGAIPVLARPGTAVLFDRRLWHMRGENRSSITRKALFYAYTFRWVRARDDIRIPPELFGTITPVRAQLLGAGSSAIGHWMPEQEDVPLRGWWRRPAAEPGRYPHHETSSPSQGRSLTDHPATPRLRAHAVRRLRADGRFGGGVRRRVAVIICCAVALLAPPSHTPRPQARRPGRTRGDRRQRRRIRTSCCW